MSKQALRYYARHSLSMAHSPSDLTLLAASSHSGVGQGGEAAGQSGTEASDNLLGLSSLHLNRRRGGHILQIFSPPLPRNRAEWVRLRSVLLRRSRPFKEPCVVPDKLLRRLDVGKFGAMVVAFSRSGHLLAVAAAASTGSGGGAYHLRLFDPDLLVEVAAAAYCHQGPIYELRWSLNDRYLLSCSGDGTVKVWDLLGLLPFCALYNSRYAGSGLGLGSGAGPVGRLSVHGNISPRASPASGALSDPFSSSKPPHIPQLLCSFPCSPPAHVYTV